MPDEAGISASLPLSHFEVAAGRIVLELESAFFHTFIAQHSRLLPPPYAGGRRAVNKKPEHLDQAVLGCERSGRLDKLRQQSFFEKRQKSRHLAGCWYLGVEVEWGVL